MPSILLWTMLVGQRKPRATHTEEHKVVKTDQDAQGNQQAKAEVVQKQVSTKVSYAWP